MPIDSKLVSLVSNAAEKLRPPPKRNSAQWAEDKRILPPGSAEPGPFNSRRAPWVFGIAEAIADPTYASVAILMGSQMSKTDGCLLNSIGWQLDDDPMPMLYIGPTRKNVESISTDRIKKMLESVESLNRGLAKGKKDKITEKFINGVRLGFGWAGSATELASHPAAKVFIDERDRMGMDVDGEGDVNTLADARTATYDGCVITASTPLVGNVSTKKYETGLEHWEVSDNVPSPTWRLWQEGSRHEWAWPCPSCREYFIPRFRLLWWPEGATPKQAFREAKISCPHCGDQHANSTKEWMNARGVFIAPGQSIEPAQDEDIKATMINDDGEIHSVEYGYFLPLSDNGTEASFWVSGLCSPWRSYGHRARTFLNAVRSGEPGRIQAAINTGFGELYAIAGDAPDWKEVAKLKLPYNSDNIPSNIQTIICGVDVQKNRVYYAIRGYGAGGESWLIEHGEIHGMTDQNEVWAELQKFRDRQFNGHAIMRIIIDSGYRASQVYDFCRANIGWAFPSKGHDNQEKPVKLSSVDITHKGKIIKNGLTLVHINTDYFKSLIHSRIDWSPDQPGAWHLAEDTDDDYCKQIVAESRVEKPSGEASWVRLSPDNHYLDCEVINASCSFWLKFNLLQELVDNIPQELKRAGRRQISKGVRV